MKALIEDEPDAHFAFLFVSQWNNHGIIIALQCPVYFHHYDIHLIMTQISVVTISKWIIISVL